MDTATITLIGSTIILVLGAVTTNVVTIIKASKENQKVVQETRDITIAAQKAGAARGKVRDKKIQEIHVLTNSKLTAALKSVVILAKKEYDRTGTDEDRRIYENAERELRAAEEATAKVDLIDDSDEDIIAANKAEAKLAVLTETAQKTDKGVK